nr:hypothetical protein [Tanacetum cinerariifolium]
MKGLETPKSVAACVWQVVRQEGKERDGKGTRSDIVRCKARRRQIDLTSCVFIFWKTLLMMYPPLWLEGLPFELESDLLPIIPRNLRIVSSDVKSSLQWLSVWDFATRRTTPLEVPHSIELGQRFYKMMNELVRNQYHVTNHQVNVQFLLQLQSEWQMFVTLVKQSQELKIVSYHKLYDILKQHQNEVNEIRAERLSQPATVTEDDEMSKEKKIYKLMVLISLSFKKIYKLTNNNLRTSSNTSRANQDNSPRINRGTGYENQRVVNVAGARETVGTQKPKRAKDAAYHKEKMLLCKQEEARVQLNAEQADWKDDTDNEYMAQIQEVTLDIADNSGPIFDAEPLQKVQNDDDNYNVFGDGQEYPEQPASINKPYPDMCYDREQDDQDNTDELA